MCSLDEMVAAVDVNSSLARFDRPMRSTGMRQMKNPLHCQT
jgi:hypothetical protein